MSSLGFGEILVLLIVGIIVVGPRRLPAMMRTAGQWVSKVRSLSSNLRAQSGIDDLIRDEGLTKSINDLRSMTKVSVLDSFVTPVQRSAHEAPASAYAAPSAAYTYDPSGGNASGAGIIASAPPFRDREYPLVGCDSYDAIADDALPYIEDPDAIGLLVPYGAVSVTEASARPTEAP